MYPPNLKFKDFTSENRYLHLKKEFLAQDYRSDPLDEIRAYANSINGDKVEKKSLRENPVIQTKHQNPLTSDDLIQEKEFKNDFIKPFIRFLAVNYFNEFKTQLDEKGLYSKDSIDGFAKKWINEMNPMIAAISNASYLDKDIKVEVIEQISILNDLISEYLQNPFPNIEEKLKFKWNKTDVIYFFHLLRKNEIIKFESDSDLGKLIDEICCYYNPTKGEYLPIANSRKLLNEFENGKGRSIEPSNKRLKEIFLKEDFFNV